MGVASSVQKGPLPPDDVTPVLVAKIRASSESVKSDVTTPVEQVLNTSSVKKLAALLLPGPTPRPSEKLKREIFSPVDYSELDALVMQTPPEMQEDPLLDLVLYLISLADASDDLGKVRAIFLWLASRSLLQLDDTAYVVAPPENTCLSYLLKIKRNEGNYAHMMAAMCNCAEIPVRILTGVNKNSAFRIGKKMDKRETAAQWNAVHIRGEWRLLDCLWSSTCVVGAEKSSDEWDLLDVNGKRVTGKQPTGQSFVAHKINEFFFLTNPSDFIATHYPDHAEWQLIYKTKSWEEFQDSLYIRDRFFELGLEITRPELNKSVLHAGSDGIAIIELKAGTDSPSVTFKYVLFKSNKNSNDTTVLQKCIFFEKKGALIKYTARFPMKGTFKFDIYGEDCRIDNGHDLVCSYLIVNDSVCETFFPLPDEPLIGWGPGLSCEAFGLIPASHPFGRIETATGSIDIIFKLSSAIEVRHVLLKGASSESSKRSDRLSDMPGCSLMRIFENTLIISLRLQERGDYALKMYANEEGIPGELQNVCNYLIACKKDVRICSYPIMEDGHLGLTTYGKELLIESLSPINSLFSAQDRVIEVQLLCNDNLELYAAVSASDSVMVDYQPSTRSALSDASGYSFRIELAKDCEHLVRIYACHSNDPERVYNVFNYLITTSENECLPQSKASNYGFVKVEELIVHKMTVCIPLPKKYELPAVQILKKNSYLPVALVQVAFESKESSNSLVKLKLADRGEYNVTLYEKGSSGTLQVQRKYTVFREGEAGDEYESQEVSPQDWEPCDADETESSEDLSDSVQDEAEIHQQATWKTARRALQVAVKACVLTDIQDAAAKYAEAGAPTTDALLRNANRLTTLLGVKEDLQRALKADVLKSVQDALRMARSINFQGRLDTLIRQGEQKLDQLRLVSQLSKAVFSLDQRTISEMRAYTQPPDAVYWVAKATFLLLGNEPTDVQDWRRVQQFLGKTGRESLKVRVMLFDFHQVSAHRAREAKEIYAKFSVASVRNVSIGAATFYVWGNGMIGLIERFLSEAGSRPE